jgi:hypothetical protein
MRSMLMANRPEMRANASRRRMKVFAKKGTVTPRARTTRRSPTWTFRVNESC